MTAILIIAGLLIVAAVVWFAAVAMRPIPKFWSDGE